MFLNQKNVLYINIEIRKIDDYYSDIPCAGIPK